MSLLAIILLVLIPCAIYIGIILYYKYNSSRHWSSIPGVCMSVGIAVTFITMYLTFQNKEKIADIISLIPEISKAFIGSLLGLGLSLIMTYWVKSRISTIEENEQKKAGENNNPYLLLQQIAENTSLNKSELEKLNTAFNTFNIKTETLNSKMIEEFSTKFENLMKKVESEAIAKSLGNLEKINAGLSKNLENIFGKTGNTIAQGQTFLKKSVDDLKGVLENKIDTINKETTANASLAKDAVTLTLDEIRTQVVNMGSSIATQADAVIAKKEESINNTFSTIDEKQQNAVQVQSGIVEKMKSIFVDMQNAFNTKIGEINNATNEIQGKIIEMGGNITEKADEVVSEKIKSLEKTFQRIEDYQGRSQTALETATSSFKEIVVKYEKVNENKEELIENIKKQLEELEEVRKNGSTLIQNWEQIAQSMENMQVRIKDINNVITQLDNIKTVLLTQQN